MPPTKPAERDALSDATAFTSPLPALLRAVWFCPGLEDDHGIRRRGLPLLFTSRPGRGKSSRIRAAARGVGFHAETVIGAVREPTDFLGLPVPAEGGLVTYAPPAWAVRADEAGHAVVFLDELNRATPAVQNAMLRVVLEGVVGDLALGPNVRFVAAQNDAGATGAWDLGDALANRFLHLAFPAADVGAWGRWMLGGRDDAPVGLDPGEEGARVDGLWPAAFAQAAGLTSAYLAARPGHFEEALEPGDPRLSGAWASARSWELATRALASSLVYALPPGDGDALVGAAVGPGIAAEFATWRAHCDLPNPAHVLDGADEAGRPVVWRHKPERLDRTCAFFGSVAALLLAERCERGGKDARRPRAEKAFALLHEAVTGGHAEAAVLCAQLLMGSASHRAVFMSAKGFQATWAALEPFTSAARMGGR